MTWQNRLRFAIARSGKTHEQVAMEAGISSAMLRQILEGQLDPDLEDIAQLASVIDVTVASLLGEQPVPEVTARRVLDAEIPPALAARGASLVYEASGDSMVHAGIADGDLLFVRPVDDPREAAGRIVVCRAGESESVRVFAPDHDGVELIGIVLGRAGPVS